jgi:hypothetical protein
MPRLRDALVALATPYSLLSVALILPFAISTVPAQAQDLFGFFRALTSPPAPTPALIAPALEFRVAPDSRRSKPKVRPRPKPAPVAQAEVKKPIEPRSPGDMDNPVPTLLADSTLRPGDMVMFPDGLRVFTGRVGGQHKLTDFKLLSQAGKALSRKERKLVAQLIPSENPAWNMDAVRSGNMLAANAGDVKPTGSAKRKGR